MINEFRIKTLLAKYGHHMCQENVDGGHIIDAEKFVDLPMDHRIVKAAVRSYQTWFKPDLDRLTLREGPDGGHRRMSIADGDAGPSTEDLFTLPRCGCPDIMPAMSEEANWPPECRLSISTSYNFVAPGLTAQQMQDVWIEADQNWADVIDVQFQFRPDDYPNTRIFAFLANLSGSVLADQYLATGDCGFRSQGRVDNRQWTDTLLVTTLTHEHGHALGAPHVQDSSATMYPSITNTSMSRRGKPNQTDIQTMLNLGYKKRTTPPEEWASGRHRVVPYGDDSGSTVLGYVKVASDGKLAEHSGKLQILDVADVDGEKFEFSRATRM